MTTITFRITIYCKVEGKFKEYVHEYTDEPDTKCIREAMAWYEYYHAVRDRKYEFHAYMVHRITTTVLEEII